MTGRIGATHPFPQEDRSPVTDPLSERQGSFPELRICLSGVASVLAGFRVWQGAQRVGLGVHRLLQEPVEEQAALLDG
jgi:hypothetical protein